MDDKNFSDIASRLEEVGKVIAKLPTEIRLEAFGLLKPYVSKQVGGISGMSKPESSGVESDNDGADDASLFSQFDHNKPSDNVRLITADLFQKYGSEPFAIEEIEKIAADAGITIPTRVDMTIRQATDGGKRLYVSCGNGSYKPTVHGETFLKTTYKVKKGKQIRASSNK